MSITVQEAERELSDLLKQGKLCIFAGSGVSVSKPSSLPTWNGFVDKYKEICKELTDRINDEKFNGILDEIDNYRNRDVDMITTITALKDILSSYEKKGINMRFSDAELGRLFTTKQYNEYHKVIVQTNYKYILTTNYDLLLDFAARENGYMTLANRVYNNNELDKISEAIYKDESAIIHMHGTYLDIKLKEFILTKEDYKRIKEKSPGFRTLMNSIFLNYSILFVGYGSSDPHLEDIIDDINMTLRWSDSEETLDLPTYYLFVKGEKLSPIFDHVKNKNRTKVIPFNDYPDMLDLLKKLQKESPRL